MEDMIINIILYIIIYSFLGWCCECIYCSIGHGEWINRGFLTGPFCPIYGFGAVAVLGGLYYFPPHVTIVFLGGMIITTILEYITSWVMEKFFSTRWWDYSNKRFNINGRVCLLNSTLFGLLCVILYFDIHPPIEEFVVGFNHDFKLGFLAAFMIYFIADLTLSVKAAMDINIRLNVISDLHDQLVAKHAELDAKLDAAQIEEKLASLNIHDELVDKLKIKQNDVGFFERRLMKSFPEMENKKHYARLEEIKQKIQKKKESLNK